MHPLRAAGRTGGIAVAAAAFVGTAAAHSGTTHAGTPHWLLFVLALVGLGAAATPAYWAFLDPSSPVGGVFFAASVLLLLGSIVRATGGGSSVPA